MSRASPLCWAWCYFAGFLGPVSVTLPSENIEEFNDVKKRTIQETSSARERELVSKGCNRVVKTAKEIRQNISKAIVQGKRSGCRMFVYEFYYNYL